MSVKPDNLYNEIVGYIQQLAVINEQLQESKNTSKLVDVESVVAQGYLRDRLKAVLEQLQKFSI